VSWSSGSEEGRIVVGRNEYGQQPNQFNYSIRLSFDDQGNLYVVDYNNNGVQKFNIDSIEIIVLIKWMSIDTWFFLKLF